MLISNADSSGTTAYGDANTSTLGAGGNRQAGNSYNALDSQRGTGAGYGSESGQTGYGQTGYGQTGSGLTGTSSGYGQTGTNSGSTVGKIESALGLGGATSGSQREYASGNSRSGLSGGNSGLSDGQNLSSGGYSSGLSGSNRPSSGSEALGDLTGEGSRTQAHGHAIQGSDLGVGKGGERYLYDSRTAPGYGGRSHDDDFSHANVHNVGSGKDIMSDLGSTVAAGHSDGAAASGVGSTSTSESRPTRSGLNRTGTGMGGGSSGLMSGMSSNNRNYDNTSGQSGYGSGAGAAAGITSGLAAVGLADHQRGNTVESYEGQQGISQGFTGGIQPSAGVAEDSSYTNKPYSRGTDFLSSGITRDSQAGAINQDTTGYGSRGVSNNNTSDDFAAGAPVSGYTSSGSGPAGASHNAAGLTNFGGHHHRSISDDLDDGCEGSK